MLLFTTTPSYADSPITSTEFYTAYLYIDTVKKAADFGVMDSEIAYFLASPINSIDVKAAVINALGWDFNGKDNAEKYAHFVYNKSVEELNLDLLNEDELFSLGYLMAMDDYSNTTKALTFLQKSNTKLNNSFTVSIVTSIVYSQETLRQPDNWPDIWVVTQKVIKNKELNRDLRPEAAKIIVDYMSLYSREPVINPFYEKNNIILHIGDSKIMVYKNNYELDYGRGTKPELKENKTFLPISPVIKALGGTTIWDEKQQKVTIDFYSRKIELWIGKKNALVNGVSTKMDVAPYTSNSRTMLPLRFIIENLGFDVKWNRLKNEIIINV